jgi:DNA gyrase/topoisomerase IV subunit A
MTAITAEAMQLMMQHMEAMKKELAEEKRQREATKKEREDDKAELASLRRMAQQQRRTTMYQPFSSPRPLAAGAEPGVYQQQPAPGPALRVVVSSLTQQFNTPQRGGQAEAAIETDQPQVAAEELRPTRRAWLRCARR